MKFTLIFTIRIRGLQCYWITSLETKDTLEVMYKIFVETESWWVVRVPTLQDGVSERKVKVRNHLGQYLG